MQICNWYMLVARVVGVLTTFSVVVVDSRTAFAEVATFALKSAWETAAGPYTTIDFTGFEQGTIITTQYQSLGVTFTEGNDRINTSTAFPNDGLGLNGAFDTFTLQFSQPMYTIACEFPGNLQFRLFWQGEQFYTNAFWFGGLVSDQPFDRVVVLDPLGDVYVDDLHFGQGIPTPGLLPLVGIALLAPRRRRR